MNGLALDASSLAHHLLMDYVAKFLIVIVALIVLAVGMTVIWRRAGRGAERRDGGHGGRMAAREEPSRGGDASSHGGAGRRERREP
ncbi:hypothetical protein [Streptomyces sp. BP-8]|uniref:Uncharacterized protein n=1 Tax=Streptomyces sirii TaxID=3127701 RepID=A0ABZ2QY11_9ACTN